MERRGHGKKHKDDSDKFRNCHSGQNPIEAKRASEERDRENCGDSQHLPNIIQQGPARGAIKDQLKKRDRLQKRRQRGQADGH